jgi:hypothetical protein
MNPVSKRDLAHMSEVEIIARKLTAVEMTA